MNVSKPHKNMTLLLFRKKKKTWFFFPSKVKIITQCVSPLQLFSVLYMTSFLVLEITNLTVSDLYSWAVLDVKIVELDTVALS